MSETTYAAETGDRYLFAQCLTAVVYGIACHLLFAAAIVAMALALFNGMRIGLGPFRGWAAAGANLVLLASIPVAHSWLLTSGGRRIMSRLVAFGIGKDLSSTVFATISLVQLLSVFLLWSPTGIVWWQAAGWFRLVIGLAAAGAWMLLAKAMSDGQLSLQTGFLGWGSVLRNQIPKFRPFATRGLYRHVRQPISISFALILWFGSVWTPDLFVLALGWTGYCAFGAVLKERRYLACFGEPFRRYQACVPFWNPFRKSIPLSGTEASGEDTNNRHADVVISGAGPVGLFLANLLGRRGRRVLVIERRRQVSRGSLAIGITPPSLGLLKSLALDHLFTGRGVRIDTARVFENRVELGDVDFSRLPAEHRFILSLPQSRTLSALRHNLRKFPNVRLVEGVEVMGHQQAAGGVCVQLKDRVSGARSEVRAAFLVGCEGHRSATRKHAGIGWRERSYRPCFLMADLDDNTTWGREAHLYFGSTGSVESFPLPEGQRRWIVQTNHIPSERALMGDAVAACVRERVGIDLPTTRVYFQSSFQPRRGLAREYVKGRVILCGDAAHVMSPIGGQGMNTGLADAAHLDRVLAVSLETRTVDREGFALYHRTRRRAFRVAADRAACGMWLGTRSGLLLSIIRRTLISRILLGSSIRERLAPYFAMLTIPGNPVVENEPLPVEGRGR